MLFFYGYVIGFIVGLLVAILMIAILAFFRSAIERKITVVQKQFENAGPRPRGFIVEPTEENDIIREKIIDENKKQGKDTPISELL